MPTTIKDVAKLAEVSPSTVSRVIADNPRISQATKEKVYKAMKELRYKPNAIARSLANSKTMTLGLIVPNSDLNLFMNPFFMRAMRGISIYAQKHGYHIMYTHTSKMEEEMKYLNEYVNSNLVDGIILMTTVKNDECIHYLKKENFPFVVIGRPEHVEATLWVDNDNFQAMYNVVNMLVSKGHHKIGYIGGSMDYNFSRDRYEGYLRALNVRGLPKEEGLIEHEADFSMQFGYNACKRIYTAQHPTAIVTTDDLLGYGALKYINEHGIKHVKVTGFNNIAMNEFQKPALTSVDIHAEELGYQAAKLLIKTLKHEEDSNHFIVDTHIVER